MFFLIYGLGCVISALIVGVFLRTEYGMKGMKSSYSRDSLVTWCGAFVLFWPISWPISIVWIVGVVLYKGMIRIVKAGSELADSIPEPYKGFIGIKTEKK